MNKKRPYSKKHISTKLAGRPPSSENWNLLYLLSPDRCISLFHFSLLPGVKSDPCQKNLTTPFPVNNLKLIKKKINKEVEISKVVIIIIIIIIIVPSLSNRKRSQELIFLYNRKRSKSRPWSHISVSGNV